MQVCALFLLKFMNNLTSTFYSNMSYKLQFESGYLFEGEFIILQIKPEFLWPLGSYFWDFQKLSM